MTELAYEKLLKEHKLTVSQLPEDAQTAIANLKSIQKGIELVEKKGQTVRADILKKLRLIDKWASYEIMDFVNDTNKNTPSEETERLAKEAEADLKKQEAVNSKIEAEKKKQPEVLVKKDDVEKKEIGGEIKSDPKGIAIEEELKSLLEKNKISLPLSELKDLAPVTYSVIFDTYESGKENGLRTTKNGNTNYELLEKENEVFILTKK